MTLPRPINAFPASLFFSLVLMFVSPTTAAFARTLLAESSSSVPQTGRPEQVAQQRPEGDSVIATADVPIFLLPDTSREPLRVARSGSRMNLIHQEGGWCNVEFMDPQLGRRVGYVQTKFVKVQLASLRPRDLSLPSAEPSIGARDSLGRTPTPDVQGFTVNATPRRATSVDDDGVARRGTAPVDEPTPSTSRSSRNNSMAMTGWAITAAGGALLVTGLNTSPVSDFAYSCNTSGYTYSVTCQGRSSSNRGLLIGVGSAISGVGVVLGYIGSQRMTIAPTRNGIGAVTTIRFGAHK
jgi:hypothetical protein